MSKWYDATISDIGIDKDEPDKLIIQVDPDYDGNVYAVVKIEDVKKVLKEKLMWLRKE